MCNCVQDLRITTAGADTATVMNTATAAATVNVTQVRLPHVVLVEDQERAARGLEELLEIEGFRVTLAQLTNVHDRTVEYVGPDRMIELAPHDQG